MQQDSRFFTLPAELRNKIYRMVLRFEGPILMIRSSVYQHAALFRVSSQIRDEAASIFCGENHFYHIMKGGGVHTNFPIYRKYRNMIPHLIIGYEMNDAMRQKVEDCLNQSEDRNLFPLLAKCVDRWVCDMLICRLPLSIMPVPVPDAAASPLDRVIAAFKAKFNSRMAEVADLEVDADYEAIEAMLPPQIHLNWRDSNLNVRCRHHCPETYGLECWKSVWNIRAELEWSDDDFGRPEWY